MKLKIIVHLNILFVHLSRGGCDDPFGTCPKEEGLDLRASLDTSERPADVKNISICSRELSVVFTNKM